MKLLKFKKFYSVLLIAFALSISVHAQEMLPKSKVYLEFTVEKESVEPKDALDMFSKELKKLTSLDVVLDKTVAEYEFKIQVLKGFMDIRKVQFDVFEMKTGQLVFKSKWQKAGSTFQYGMSGTRAAIVIAIRKQLIKKYPKIKV